MWHRVTSNGVAKIFICVALAAAFALGTGFAMSQNVRDLQPAPDQPPLERLPR